MSGMVTVTGRDELGRVIDVRLTTVGLGIIKTGPGALVAFTAGAQAAGEVKVYALIAEPA
jgi:hypothetical protein